MSKAKNAPAEAGGGKRQRPPHGGRFIRDPKTGELECVEQTGPAGASSEEAPATEPESGSDQAELSGGAAASGSGSTDDDSAEQEG